MTNDHTREQHAGGLAGKVAAKVKQAAGSLLGDRDLEREGALQEAAVDARDRAARFAGRARHEEARADLAEEQAAVQAERAELGAEELRREREEEIQRDRDAAEIAAERRRIAAEREAQTMRERAEQAERTGDALDPGEGTR